MLSYSYPGTVKFFDHTATREEILDDYSYLEDADISAALVYAAKYLDHTVMHVAWMRFLIDAQLPPALARWIESLGHKAEHVADIGMNDANDREIWLWARETNAIIISKDSDFVTLATLEENCPPVIWIRLGNTRRRAVVRIYSLTAC